MEHGAGRQKWAKADYTSSASNCSAIHFRLSGKQPIAFITWGGVVDSIAVSVFVLFYSSLTNILEIRIFLKSETRTKRTLVVRRAGLSKEGGVSVCVNVHYENSERLLT